MYNLEIKELTGTCEYVPDLGQKHGIRDTQLMLRGGRVAPGTLPCVDPGVSWELGRMVARSKTLPIHAL